MTATETHPDEARCTALCQAMWQAVRAVTPADTSTDVFLACLGETALRGVELAAGRGASEADRMEMTRIFAASMIAAASAAPDGWGSP
jgi:hypothetical protein